MLRDTSIRAVAIGLTLAVLGLAWQNHGAGAGVDTDGGLTAGATGYDPAVTSLTMPPGGTIYHDTPQTKTVTGTVKNEGSNQDVFTVTLRAEHSLDFSVSWIAQPGDTVTGGPCTTGPCFWYAELTYTKAGIDPGESVPVSRDLVVSCPNPSLNFFKTYSVTLSASSEGGDDNPADSQITGSQSHTCVAENPNADPDGDTIGNGADPDDDGDECPDVNEEQSAFGSEFSGGRRNRLNPNDYFNPTDDGENRVDDIVAVVNQYFDDDDDSNPGQPPYEPGYNPGTDRTHVGPYLWNLGPPNGQQRVDDIVNQVNQYFHDCS
jgi:hypothetical protein